MGKRKRENDEEYFMRKIREYQNKLSHEREKQNSSARSSSSPDRDPYDDECRNEDMYTDRENISPDPEEVHDDLGLKSVINIVPENINPEQHAASPDKTIEIESNIPTEILELLGEAKKLDPELGTKIPEEIAERWGKILLDGLAKDQKETLKAKMLIPENFTLARAPKLNHEVQVVLTDSAKNRDKHLETAQNQLGTGIAGLVNLTKDLIHTQTIDKMDILKRISEISQILLDLHYEETYNRRKLIVPLLDKNFWNIIKGVKRDDLLFGSKLSENIKASKDIEKSSQQIKKAAILNNTGNRRILVVFSREMCEVLLEKQHKHHLDARHSHRRHQRGGPRVQTTSAAGNRGRGAAKPTTRKNAIRGTPFW